MNRQEHWDLAYRSKGAESVSWFQRRPDLSLAMIEESCVGKDEGIIDVGGGASNLVDSLLDLGYRGLAVLDVSAHALSAAKTRLGARADLVEWIVADVTAYEPARRFGLWHDRAVFHFLTDPGDRRCYVDTLRRAIQAGGSVVMATFAMDGPAKCSGLEVARYDQRTIAAEFGDEFEMADTHKETHLTPWGAEQRFIYFRFRRRV